MICLGNPVLNTTLSIQAAYLRNWTSPVEEDGEESLSKGGIAGIVIACVVVFLFAVGLYVCKGKEWCFKNKTQSLPDESPRTGDLERRETGLAASNEIAHQPSNQASGLVSPSKDLTRQPLSGLLDHDVLGNSVNNPDLNATGHHLLSGKQSHEGGPDHSAGLLPNIIVNKEGAAKEWNALDREQHLSGPGSEGSLASNRNE